MCLIAEEVNLINFMVSQSAKMLAINFNLISTNGKICYKDLFNKKFQIKKKIFTFKLNIINKYTTTTNIYQGDKLIDELVGNKIVWE